MASFSNNAKTEICGSVKNDADRRAFMKGVLLAVRQRGSGMVQLHTECRALAAMLPQLMHLEAPGASWDTEYRSRVNKPGIWSYTLPTVPTDPAAVSEIPDLPLILSGLFVSCGSVTDPQRGYHLELVLPDAALAAALQRVLAEMTPAFPFKTAKRGGATVLYLKHNEQISDVLMLMGAPHAAFDLMNRFAEKNLRSQTNRRMNCDLANIDKSVAAGAQQIADINKIAKAIGLSALPEPLQEIAAVRLREPDANLRDLGAMLHPPLSRSGVHHRLAKIAKIAEKLS